MTLSPRWNVCVYTVHMQKQLTTVSEHSHPPTEPYPHALSGWCCHDNRVSVTDRHAHRVDTWEDSCHLGRLMTSSQQRQGLTRTTSRITPSQLTDWQLQRFKREKQSGRKIKSSKLVCINKLKGRSLLWITLNRKHLDCLWNPLHCLYNPITGAISHGRRRVIQPNLIIILQSAITRGSFICVGFERK